MAEETFRAEDAAGEAVHRVADKTLNVGFSRLQHAMVDGRIAKSVSELSKILGVSPTTTQRLITQLVAEGKLRRIKASNPSLPDTLELIGPESTDPLAKEAVEVIAALRAALEGADALIQKLMERDAALSAEVLEYRSLKDRTISDVTDKLTGNRMVIYRPSLEG